LARIILSSSTGSEAFIAHVVHLTGERIRHYTRGQSIRPVCVVGRRESEALEKEKICPFLFHALPICGSEEIVLSMITTQ